jgi:transcriptional regulator with XRE-family HTH domain
MHNAGVDRTEIAAYMGVTKSYITAILNGRKTPPNAKERLNTAFAEVVASRQTV